MASQPEFQNWGTKLAAADYIRVKRADRNAYTVDFCEAFNIGAVPNGGYVAAHFVAAALQHVAEYGHTNVIATHWDFLGRSQPGRGILLVDEVKIARNMSVLYIALYQDGQLSEAPWVSPDAKRVAVGSVTCRDMATEVGVSIDDGGWALLYPPPLADLDLLARGQEPNWGPIPKALQRDMRASHHWNMYEQKRGFEKVAFRDLWFKYGSGARIRDLDLPYLIDITPAVTIRGFQLAGEKGPPSPDSFRFWYPTLNIHMDFKKGLPKEGVKWLRLRTTIKVVKNGRFDCDVDIFDETGDMVAQARHMSMVVDSARNTANRKPVKLTHL